MTQLLALLVESGDQAGGTPALHREPRTGYGHLAIDMRARAPRTADARDPFERRLE